MYYSIFQYLAKKNKNYYLTYQITGKKYFDKFQDFGSLCELSSFILKNIKWAPSPQVPSYSIQTIFVINIPITDIYYDEVGTGFFFNNHFSFINIGVTATVYIKDVTMIRIAVFVHAVVRAYSTRIHLEWLTNSETIARPRRLVKH